VIMSVLFIRWMQQQEREPREEESMWEAIHQPDQQNPPWRKPRCQAAPTPFR